MPASLERRHSRSSTPARCYKMGPGPLAYKDTSSSRPRNLSNADLLFASLPRLTNPQTPPESRFGSPAVKPEGYFSSCSRECSPIPRLTRPNSPSRSAVKLPSLEEFDQGVEALARSHGSSSWAGLPASPLRRASLLPHLSTSSFRTAYSPPPPREASSSSPSSYLPYSVIDPCSGYPSLDGYPSPPPESENRHINQKYTTEEGDFIIYAWHDKKLKWQRIKQDFAAMFGRTPERTVQGLQAWYYRMNQRIPLWDEDGWLIFDGEDDLEPKHISIKCRERDSQDKPMEPLGIAQRYPERAIHYSWVDSDTKRKARDWASKRALQYRERRERRKRKEQRRMKL